MTPRFSVCVCAFFFGAFRRGFIAKAGCGWLFHMEISKDTWDHFKIPQCDSGPPKGSMELVHWLQNVPRRWVGCEQTLGDFVVVSLEG